MSSTAQDVNRELSGAASGAASGDASGDARALRADRVRRTNLAMVLDHVRRRGSITRSELVAATGLTRTAIGDLVGALAESGLVDERAAAPSGRPGRPSPAVYVDGSGLITVALEVGVDGVDAAAVGLDGSVVEVAHVAADADLGIDATVERIRAAMDHLGVQGHRVGSRTLHGVGIAVPGLVRDVDGFVLSAPNLGWVDVDVAAEVRSALGDPAPIHVGNEADLGAMAESRAGAGRGADVLVYVSGEVGIGGGVIVEGERLAGHSGLAGEFGHVPVDPAGGRCRCGSIGCWETVVGERALLERAGLDPLGGPREVDRLCLRAERGDGSAAAAMTDHGRWLAIGITALINVFDPDVVVLGGLLRRTLPLVRPTLDAELDDRRIRAVGRTVRVVAAELEPSSTLIGAAELAYASLLADPAA